MDSKTELKNLVREMMDEDALKKNQDEMEEKYAKLLEQNTELKAAEEARIAAPAKKVSLEVPGSDKKVDFLYKGFDLRRQGLDIEIADPEVKDTASKFIIDMFQKDMTSGSTTGGILVPDEFSDVIMSLARVNSVALRECKIFNISRDTLKIPVEATGTTMNVEAFGTANTQSEPTLTEVTLAPKRIGNYSVINEDLASDSVFDILSWISSLNAEAIAKSIDQYVFTGAEFTGDLFDCTTNSVTVTGTIADVSYAHFSEAISQLTDNKLAGAKFYMNRAATHYIRTETDTAGRLIWTPPSQGNPATIYGYPYVQVEKLPGAPTAGNAFGVFGNLNHYYLAVRRGLKMTVNPYILMKEGQIQIVSYGRFDGDVGIESALSLFKLSA